MEWLAAAATDPRACKRQWHDESGTAVLACGRLWDVLSVPEDLGVLALDALLRIPEAPGPVLADAASRRVAFFLPPDPESRWIGSGIRYAGKGSWIAAPAPHQAAGRLRWLVPPDGTGALFVPAAVELALHLALGRLAAQSETKRPCPTCGAPATGSAPHADDRPD
ncbi:bifunctional DNA primase/polymerase [Streptomyces phyllanthi]|nr:bifunctional DNA primase/polymerase [Streptomyces phyllanthi]